MDALRGLTTRGRAFVSAGVACAASAGLVGQHSIFRLGAFLLALPILAAISVSRTRYRLTCTRTLVPSRVPVGHPTQVHLRLDNVSRLPTSVLFVEDTLSYTLGPRARFILDRVRAGESREISYAVRADTRGRYAIGPLSLRLTDPFGLCELTRSFTSVDELVVTPVVTPLPSIGLGGEWAGGGETQARQVASAGEDDASTREYRFGDDLRKVHWKSTARTGELMVRREEQPWQSRATVFLDTRLAGHQGDGPSSSFEWVVAAAASAGVHLSRGGYTLRYVTTSGTDLQTERAGGVEHVLLDQLAVVEMSATGTLEQAALRLHRGSEGLIVALLGAMRPEDALAIGRLRQAASAGIAILVDTATWTALSPRARAESEAALDSSAALLAQAGWRVLIARHGQTLPSLWPQAASRRGLGVLR